MRAFLKNVLSRFIQVQSIVDAGDDITKVKYKDPSCQMSDDKLYIGIVTRVKQRKLLDEGDIDSNASLTFLKGIQSFYHCATEYALSHLPFDDDVLLNAQFVNIQRRVTADFTQVAYFVEHFPILLPFCDTKSQEQFFEQVTSCQTMHDSAISLHIWSDAKVTEKAAVLERTMFTTEWTHYGHILAQSKMVYPVYQHFLSFRRLQS